MKLLFILYLLSFVLIISCAKEDQKSELQTNSKPIIVTVNYPLYYFAQRIGGEHIDLAYPIPADVDPAYWTPDEKAISIYQSADIILDNGAGYAKWMDKISLPASRIENTSRDFQDKYIELEGGSTHSHGPEGEHVHKGFAFTTWLDFKLAQKQALVVKEALIKKLPEKKENFEVSFNMLSKHLQSLDDKMTEIALSLQKEVLYGSHPVYQYLEGGYGLTILSEHWEPGEEPSAEQWKVFKDKVKKNPGRLMLWEGQPLQKVEKELGILGIKCVVFNPCGNIVNQSNFFETMNKNLFNLQNAL